MMLRVFYFLMALIAAGNGVYMVAAPESWFHHGPEGVPDTGPFNGHFVQDVGMAGIVAAIGFIWCAFNLGRCFPVHVGLTLLLAGHGLVHVADIVRDKLPADHWRLDAAGIFLPALLMAILCIQPVWRWVNPAAKPRRVDGSPVHV